VGAVTADNTPRTREFPLDEVLTVTTGKLVARRHMDAVYDVLNHLTGDNLLTHQLPRALNACLPAVLAQHTDLAAIRADEVPSDADAIWQWLERMESEHGSSRALTPISDWLYLDPVEELCDMAGTERVYVVPIARWVSR